MVIIFSTEIDYDSQSVIDWLDFMQQEHILIDSSKINLFKSVDLSVMNNDPTLSIYGKKVD